MVLNEKYAKGGKYALDVDDAAAYVHVDDGLLMTIGARDSPPKSDELMEAVADGWEAEGFLVTERVEAADDLKAVGYRVQRYPPSL